MGLARAQVGRSRLASGSSMPLTRPPTSHGLQSVGPHTGPWGGQGGASVLMGGESESWVSRSFSEGT